MNDRFTISKTVWVLSLVSLFTDVASEALYPVMPAFLKSIGFTVVWIGLLEGLAEAIAGISKGYFGNLSDTLDRRVPFVRMGYLLSALSKPLMAITTFPLWIFFARLSDRIGKGLRTAPRDAILSLEAKPETKGKIFGLHRSFDTIGAVVGPSLALLFLHWYPAHYRHLFLLAFFPGLMAILLTFIVKEKAVPAKPKTSVGLFAFTNYWKSSPASYKRLLIGLLFFALINSSDVFLLLRAREAGLSDEGVIGIYIFYNLVYASFSYPVGALADKMGLYNMLIAGLLFFILAYAGMAHDGNVYWYGLTFFLYGLYAAATESIAKALISNIADKKDIATALGTYNAFQSLATLGASTLAGIIWFRFGPVVLFIGTSLLTLATVIYLLSSRSQISSSGR